jgi:3'-phosphoadenosine 5'-phosphosulfate sulfotransferase (PAPS reductase)/FAD synthetase
VGLQVIDPFKIDGPAQIGLSGGRSSAKMLWELLRAHGGSLPSDAFVTFQNTSKEREETLVFVDAIAREWGVKVHWIEFCGIYPDLAWKVVDFASAARNGEVFDAVLLYYATYRFVEKMEPPILPNVANRMCSDRMKIKAAEWFMRSQGFDEWDAYIGIRADEQRRHSRMMASNGKNRWDSVCPMFTAGITKADVNAFWKAQPFDLGIDSDMGNCDGCFLKHEDKLLRAFRAEPWRADWWIEKERQTGQLFRIDRANYKTMKWTAEQQAKHPQITIAHEALEGESLADCFCGD